MEREIKHTEIGDIPVDWKFQTFDETFRVLSNNTLSRENLNNRSGAIRNIHYGDILTKFPEVLDCNKEKIPYVNDLSMLSSSTQLLQDGDIVVADTAEDETVGKVTEVQNLGDSKLVAGLHTIPCRVKKGDFAPGWLGYYMNSDLFHNQILPYITGIKVSSISKGAISETLILVPPFDEQEKIVQSLNKIQLLMTAETKVVNKIKLVKNGCLSKMFPQKDDTVPEIRLPGFTEAWEQRKLGDIYGSIGNAFVGTATPYYAEHGHFYLESNNVKDGQINHNAEIFINDEFYEKQKDKWLHTGDMVMVQSGHVGHAAVIPEELDNTAAHALIMFRNPKEEIEPYFLNYEYQTDKAKKQIENITTGNTIKHILASDMQEFVVDIPKYEEQKAIAGYFCKLDHLITLHQRKCDKYSSIKKGMMSDLLTGKIRLV